MTSPPLRVGVLGLSHDHIWNHVPVLRAGEVGRLVAVAEPDPALRARLAREYGAVDVSPSPDALLERRDLDAVLVYSDNRASAEWARRAVERGLPTMLEKPMAADLAGADALLAASRAGGVPLMVNWPSIWRPALVHALDLVRGGAVGEPVQVSNRGGHMGPKEYGCSDQFCEWLYDPARTGGGALIDYCCYGALLCRTLLGRPTSVTAVASHLRKEGLPSEDNAIVILRYPRALGLLEASWTQIGGQPAYSVIVYGDAATLLVHQPKATHEGGKAGAGQIELVTNDGSHTIDALPLPEDARDGTTYFLARVRDGRPIEGLCAPDLARDVQEVLSAALQANESRREIMLADLV